ncbi:DUF262 domain-containing protein [Intestinibacter sp.]|uniref:DUF262 domain-containing protein n=1 Tax=Intestinibacter sp. TaxID=1965304 RepID=UPI002A91EEC8|nr:DUF262 domain-containing HNH endonuclease family protein [Intestinibacter sp.]MDY5213042.1 DUF262 domain-containing HNH endonuclease family protein [Intestinibacter sp.]
MSITNSSFRPVGAYIQEKTYWIPDYQREYSWDADEQVEDFWMDIESLIEEGRKQHFFGQIVVHVDNEDEKYYIIDGQQRTSTSIIFLSVINNLFKEMENEYKSARNRCEDIRLKYIGRFSEEENELKLFMGKIDREYFQDNIQAGIPQDDNNQSSPSHKRIKKAFYYFDKKLREKVNTTQEISERYKVLNLYYKTFIEKFQVMYVETDDINEAFIIFETLNDRGKALETADLLKNHVLRRSGDRIDTVKGNWEKILDVLDNIDTTKFIRHYWNATSKFTRERDLYKRIRDKISNAKESEEFTFNLIKAAKVYKSLVNPNDETYFLDSELVNTLIKLNEMGARSFYPIILAMSHCNFNDQDILKVTKALEVLVLRNFVVAGKVANKYEIVFAKIAYNISHREYLTAEQIVGAINKEIISDEEFFNAFTTFTIKKTSIIRYILSKINNSLNSEVQIVDNNDKVHIEHIMPKGKGDWNINDEDHQRYLWRIGNLTLLGAEYNRKNSNKLFEDKKEMYSKSKIDISNVLTKYNKWNIKEIEERQKELAKLAKDIWAIRS